MSNQQQSNQVNSVLLRLFTVEFMIFFYASADHFYSVQSGFNVKQILNKIKTFGTLESEKSVILI